MPISDQVMRDLRDIVRSTRQDELADMTPFERTVFRVLPDLLDEVERLRLDASDYRRAVELTELAIRTPFSRNEVGAMLTDARQLVAAQADSTLPKDFLALYNAARSLVAAWQPHEQAPIVNRHVEGLELHVSRLAPLYDDVRMRLNLLSSRLLAEGMPPGVMRSGPLEPYTPEPTTITIPVAPWRVAQLERLPAKFGASIVDRAWQAMMTGLDVLIAKPPTYDPAHTVRVMGSDGVTRTECDHKFVGGPNCAHCGKPFAELQRESRREAEQLANLHAALHTEPVEHPTLPEAEVDVVTIVLGPTLRRRVDVIVKTHRLGSRLDLVVQTMFILGLLDAEGMDPRAYIGEPKQHVSVDGSFIRFALPHAEGAERLEVLRSVFAWLHAWLGDGDPLQPAAAAALAALPK